MFTWLDEERRRDKTMHFQLVLGSVYPHDAQVRDATRNIRYVIEQARPGAIIIVHTRRGDRSVEQVHGIAEGLQKERWAVKSVERIQDMIAHRRLAAEG